MDCPKCGAINADRANECGGCGAELPHIPRRRGWLWRHPLLTAVSAAVVSGLIGGLFLLLKSSGGDVVLISVDRTQADQYVPGTHDPTTPNRNVSNASLPSVDDPALRGQPVDGTRPGMYGRSGNGVSCDVTALVGYLTDSSHTAQARTWAGIVGIASADIPAYFAKLTPVRLRFDTRVTNYGYKNGTATSSQAVLQAGTSVLVDNRGVPRAKCNCGNPLAQPRGTPNTGAGIKGFAQNPQDAWTGFDPNRTATFSPGQPVNTLVLIDLDDGTAYRRDIGSSGANDTPINTDDPACTTLAQTTNCGGPGPQPTAQDTAALQQAVRGLADAVRNHDCAQLFDSLSTASVTALATQLGLDRQSFLTNCQQGFSLLQSFGGLTIIDITIVSQTGAHATISVTATLNGHTATGQNNLVRENGNWKLDIGT